MSVISSRTENKWSGKFTISRSQIVVLGVVLILIGTFLLGRQFGWSGVSRSESVAIPSGAPYAEARVIGAYERVVLARRIARSNTGTDKTALPNKMEILTDEKTVFAKITPSGPVKMSWSQLAEGDIIWVYVPAPAPAPVRTLEDASHNQVPSEWAIPFEEMMKNPRERIRAAFVVAVGGK